MKDIENFENYSIDKNGNVVSKTSGKIIKQKKTDKGYLTVFIKNNSGKYKTCKVHRLVATVFLQNPENLPEVNHKDGIKSNNNLSNLEWVSSKDNKKHAWETGLYTHKCENHHATSLTSEIVEKACELLSDGYRNKEVCDILNLDKHTVANIKSQRVWKEITCKYSFKIKRKDRKDSKVVEKVCKLLEEGHSVTTILSKINFKMKDYDIRRIKNRKIFKSISIHYNF